MIKRWKRFSSSLVSSAVDLIGTKTNETDARLPTGLLIGAPWINSFKENGESVGRGRGKYLRIICEHEDFLLVHREQN